MRPAFPVLVLALAAGGARAAEPVDAPNLFPPGATPHHPVPDRDLPGWLGEGTGLGPRQAAPVGGGGVRWNLLPFVLQSPLIGAGAGLAVVGGIRPGEAPRTSFSSFAVSVLATTRSQRSANRRAGRVRRVQPGVLEPTATGSSPTPPPA